MKNNHSWALITGASSGIGKEFAIQLGQQGFHLVLIARRESLLKELAAHIKATNEVQVVYKSIDLVAPNFIDQIDAFTDNKNLEIVVSNAGYGRMGAFHKFPISEFENVVKLNVFAQMKLAHWFINRSIPSKGTHKLLMVSSTTAFQGVPYAAEYAAGKAYILNLGEAIHHEVKDKGINVTVLVPGPTSTPGLLENEDADMVSHLPMKPQSAEKLVKEGLKALRKNKPFHIGGAPNRIMYSMMKLLMSRSGASKFWGKMMSKMVFVR